MKFVSSAPVFLALMAAVPSRASFLSASPKPNNAFAFPRVQPKSWRLEYRDEADASMEIMSSELSVSHGGDGDLFQTPSKEAEVTTETGTMDMEGSPVGGFANGLAGPSQAGLVLTLVLTGGMIANAPGFDGLLSLESAVQAGISGLDLDLSSLSQMVDFDASGAVSADALATFNSHKLLDMPVQWANDMKLAFQQNLLVNMEEFKAPLMEQSSAMGDKIQLSPIQFQEWKASAWMQAQAQTDQVVKSIQEALPFHTADEFFNDVSRVAATKTQEITSQSQAIVDQAQAGVQNMMVDVDQQVAASVAQARVAFDEASMQVQTAVKDITGKTQNSISSAALQVEEMTTKLTTTVIPDITNEISNKIEQAQTLFRDTKIQVTEMASFIIERIKNCITQIISEGKHIAENTQQFAMTKSQEMTSQSQAFMSQAQEKMVETTDRLSLESQEAIAKTKSNLADASMQGQAVIGKLSTGAKSFISAATSQTKFFVEDAILPQLDAVSSKLSAAKDSIPQIATEAKEMASAKTQVLTAQSQAFVGQAQASIRDMTTEARNQVASSESIVFNNVAAVQDTLKVTFANQIDRLQRMIL